MKGWKSVQANQATNKSEEELSLVDKVLARVSPLLPKRAREYSAKRLMKLPHVSSVETQMSDAACSIFDSPFRILKAAAKGNLQEFQKLYEADNTKLNITDSKGRTAIHKASEAGKVAILEFIHDHGGIPVQNVLRTIKRLERNASCLYRTVRGKSALQEGNSLVQNDLDVQDKQGHTPLHVAVVSLQTVSIDFLIQHGADTAILNDDELAPIHLAVEVDAVTSLKALLGHSEVDANLRGEKGLVALHYCAFKDRDECAKLLLQHGAKPCNKCDNGFFPINIAGKCAAARTLEVLIRHVESLGYKREDVLSFSDKENNMPLHCAVNSGDLKAVEVCLSAGAPCDAKQHDSSTPLHFACSQGSLDMVRMMGEKQTERFNNALHTQDVLKMTPLHRAALFDHVAVVKYLIDKGADINAQDVHDRTPLLVSSSKGAWRTTHLLIKSGSDISMKDKENRNFLHLAIKYGNSIDNFGCEVIKSVKNLLNERDDFGCTPLHYASKEGHLVAIDDLIKLGATINPKDNDKKSPFHFAAKYGRYNTCRLLLDSDMGPNIINETDGDGLSALHIAAQNGHTKIITLLMQRGAYVTKDNSDNSPLHLAAANGYTRSMKLLLTVYPNLLDGITKEGDTALHVAAKNNHVTAVEFLMSLGASFKKNQQDETFVDILIQERHSEVAFAIIRHQRWEEALQLCSKEYYTPLNGLVQHLPDACMAALDRCVTTSKHDRRSSEFCVHYNFKYLQCPLKYLKGRDKQNRQRQPMFALNTMVQHGRVRCLSHPLSEAFLQMKWRAYGSWFHVTNLVVYAIFLALLTVLVTTCTYQYREVSTNQTNTSDSSTQSKNSEITSCEFTATHRMCVYVVFIFCCLNMLKEIGQIYQQKRKYFLDLTNPLEWILYGSTMMFIVPFITHNDYKWQWEAGALAVFLAWFNCLLFLQRFDLFGIYVVMFLEILKTLLQVLSVFSILLIAFGMSFYMLLHKEENSAFMTPGLSILRSTMMMLELDYMASFNEPYTDDNPLTLYFGGTVIVLLVVFTLLMPILLMNLLIGLAVGDIESVQKNATLKRLAMQVELHTNLEAKLPMRILQMVDKPEYNYFPNKCASHISKLWSKLSFLGDNLDDQGNYHQAHIYEELYKQKLRIKDISVNMSKQYDLLRLIVQKMEIQTEADNMDEGASRDGPDLHLSKWVPAKQNVLKQSAIVANWKKSMDDCY